MTINRREFLGRCAAGGASIVVPTLLSGCASQPDLIVEEVAPDNLFTSWFGVDHASVSRVMSRLTGSGADFADAFFQVATHNRIVFENGTIIEDATDSRQGAAMRVMRGDDTGFAITRDLALPNLLTAAVSAGGATGTAVESPMPLSIAETSDLYPVGIAWSSVSRQQKVQLLEYLDQHTRAREAAVESVTIRWDDVEDHVMIATADGRLVSDTRPLARLTLIVTAVQGDARQTGFAGVTARHGIELYSEERLDALIADAVERTMVQFEARRAPVGELPVVLTAATGGVLLHEAMGHNLEADFVIDGTSPYADQLGEKVADASLTLVEDSSLPREPGSLNFDDEGVATGRTVLVEKGELRSLVHDRRTARHFGVAPMGSGRRASFEYEPLPRLASTVIQNGPHTKDEIIAAVEHGVICETIVGGQADIESGDFSFRIKNGWIVDKGQIIGPTKDFQIMGKGAELLGNITMVGNDLQMDPAGWVCGKRGQNLPVSHGAPTMLAAGLTVTAD